MVINYFFYLLLGFIIIYTEIKRDRYTVIDHLSLFNFFFFLVYVFGPISLIYYGESIVPPDLIYGKFYINKNPFIGFIVFTSYLVFLIGYYWNSPRRFASRFEVEYKLSPQKHIYLVILAYIFLVSIMIVYIKSNGGLARTVANAENFRSGVLIANKPYLVKLFSINSLLLYYSYYQVFLKKNNKLKNIYILFFITSIAIFMIRSALMNSRGFILLTFLGIYIITAIYHKKYFFKIISIVGVFGILFIKYGDPFFRAIPDLFHDGFDAFVMTFEHRIERENLQHHNISSNFLHPIISLGTALSVAGDSVPYRYFQDFWGAVIAIMPNSLIGIKEPRLVQSVITKLLYSLDAPIVLPGMLATFAFSFNILGIYILIFLYGIYGGILSELFRNIYKKNNGFIVLIYAITMGYGYFVFRGSPKNYLLSMFSPIFVMVILLIFSKIYYKKENSK